MGTEFTDMSDHLDDMIIVDEGPVWVGVDVVRENGRSPVDFSKPEQEAFHRGEWGFCTVYVSVREDDDSGHEIYEYGVKGLRHGEIPGVPYPLDPTEHEELPRWVGDAVRIARQEVASEISAVETAYQEVEIPGILEGLLEARKRGRELIEALARIQEDYGTP